jgi:hypothetical protein
MQPPPPGLNAIGFGAEQDRAQVALDQGATAAPPWADSASQQGQTNAVRKALTDRC